MKMHRQAPAARAKLFFSWGLCSGHRLAIVGLLCFFSMRAVAAAEPLSVLLITADDLNMDSAGWLGATVRATPRLDAFAGTAHQFINQHVTAAICQPSRSALMTGRVPHRNGALGFQPIRTDVPTLVELLQARSYYTAAINKVAHMQPESKFPWHLALNGSGKDPQAMRAHIEQALAEAKDRPFFINANITDPHRPFPGSEQQASQRGKKAGAKKGGVKKDGAKQRPDQSEEADGAVTAYRDDQVSVPAFLEDIPPVRHEVAEYFTAVRRFDRSLAEILAALDASGRADRTIVAVMSDHGMSFPFSKATVYRNGTWSPLLVRIPGQPPQRREEFVSSVDLLPSLLELLSVEPPQGLDGRSWVPLLKGETQPNRDYVITHINTVSSGKSFPQRCIRTKDHAYQFHAWSDGETQFRVEAMNGITFDALATAATTNPRIAKRVQQYRIGTPQALYDLRQDADERDNVLHDPRYRDELARLRGLLLEHMQRTGDPLLEKYRQATSPAG